MVLSSTDGQSSYQPVYQSIEFPLFGAVYGILQRKNTEDKLTHLCSPSSRTIPACTYNTNTQPLTVLRKLVQFKGV